MAYWDEGLQALLSQGVISGFALVDACGEPESCFGSIDSLVCDAESEEPSHLVRTLQSVFAGLQPIPTSLALGPSESAIVVRADESEICAVTPGRTVGLMASHLRIGLLLVTFGPPNLFQSVTPQVDRAVAHARSLM
ncbi:hypothetical protein H632_c87p1 [Helicosporidium sp. ATCC 50920]|nr:hypothetical protein H632_c87p1 [Helicosporidium sp. ATCC 50920]|eukprot:KDD76849.1 hypothetical protein H632_c87p1 [Helicosporidium sp. ATCC 50920]